jgi:hypothetical protein
LKELKVTVENIDTLPPSGEGLPNEIRQRIQRADFVCGLLVQPQPPDRSYIENVLFELGVAVGSNKPIFIVSQSRDLIPFSLASYPNVLGAADDGGVLKFHLYAFLKGLNVTRERVATRIASEGASIDRKDTSGPAITKPPRGAGRAAP